MDTLPSSSSGIREDEIGSMLLPVITPSSKLTGPRMFGRLSGDEVKKDDVKSPKKKAQLRSQKIEHYEVGEGMQLEEDEPQYGD